MKHTTSILLTLVAAVLLSACGGPKGTRVTEGTQTIGTMPTGTTYATKEASIVHVDLAGRLATMRNGNTFKTGTFLIVTNREGEQTGVLKALAKRPLGLRTADVLEGEPNINNLVTPANATETARFEKIYRDPEQQ